MDRAAPRGQVLVIFSILLVILLGFAGIAIDLGRQVAERRHAQTAADAAALAACRELIAGATDSTAATTARQVALANLTGSPSGAVATIDSPPTYTDEDGSGVIDADELVSGIVVAGTKVRVAISSTVDTALATGRGHLDAGDRRPCALRPPGRPGRAARRAALLEATWTGRRDSSTISRPPRRARPDRSIRRIRAATAHGSPASEAAPGLQFSIYGPGAKSNNDSSFRGFVALDVRNFEGVDTRVYYNGVTAGTNPNTLKDMQGEYLYTGYPGPAFPAVSVPPTGDTQVAVLSGNSSAHIVQPFGDAYRPGDRVLLAVYDGTVMQIPDFAIVPPAEITLASTTTAPYDGPTFTVSRNAAFTSTVTLNMVGDAAAAALGMPALDILPDPSVTPPAAGDMTEPIWSVNVFQPTTGGTSVRMNDMQTNAIPPGIYAVWLEGESGNPYYQQRRVPVAVRVQTDGNNDGDYNDAVDIRTTRDFSLANSIVDGSTEVLGGTITLPLRVSTGTSTANWGSGPAAETNVALSWDTDSLTTCSLQPRSLGTASIGFSSTSVVPSTGTGTLSTLTINTSGLAQGCYLFNIRGHGTNSNGQPVTHLDTVRFTVASSSSSGQYVDVIGYAVFHIDSIDSNDIIGHAVSGISADPQDPSLRRAQRSRLVPWS